MCTRYVSPAQADIERQWQVRPRDSQPWPGGGVYPRALAPFIRRDPRHGGCAREQVTGLWGLIPWFAEQPRQRFSTQNARSEELAQKASYRQPWARGQRCIVPALAFDEPCWETGRNVWWQLRRADGRACGLAGLWNTWVDRGSGEVHESYTLLTINADKHPLMSRMHKPDPALPPDRQDKRSVIVIEDDDVDRWLQAPVEQARELLTAPADDVLVGAPLITPPPAVARAP